MAKRIPSITDEHLEFVKGTMEIISKVKEMVDKIENKVDDRYWDWHFEASEKAHESEKAEEFFQYWCKWSDLKEDLELVEYCLEDLKEMIEK